MKTAKPYCQTRPLMLLEAMARVVNFGEAKARFDELVDAVESEAESEIIIARRGKPVALLVPLLKEPARTQTE